MRNDQAISARGRVPKREWACAVLAVIMGVSAGLRSSSAQEPTARLEPQHVTYFAADLEIPLLTRNADAADGLRYALRYDASTFRVVGFEGGTDWLVVRSEELSDGQFAVDVRYYGELDDATRQQDQAAGTFIVEVNAPSAEPDGEGAAAGVPPFRTLFSFAVVEADSGFYRREAVGALEEPVAGSVQGGEIAIYTNNGVELGAGDLTDARQTFSVPIYLTHLGDEPPQVLGIGIDYDELFLSQLRINAGQQDGPAPEVDPNGAALVAYEVRLNTFEVPAVRQRIGELRVQYHGGLGEGCTTRIDPVLLHIDNVPAETAQVPANDDPDDNLDDDPCAGEREDPDDEPTEEEGDGVGAAIASLSVIELNQTPPAIFGALPTYFVRGNVDSSKGADGSLTGDVSDVVRILSARFMEGVDIPCLEAADANQNGWVDVTDAVVLLNHLFRSGPQPHAPYPHPGLLDAYDGGLGCEQSVPRFSTR